MLPMVIMPLKHTHLIKSYCPGTTHTNIREINRCKENSFHLNIAFISISKEFPQNKFKNVHQ
uniref:Uncharacterized protein n=1 Tax=Glossina palpalis gambiensis TaxID=67801 RepID=A0A1B0BN56_9MUSC